MTLDMKLYGLMVYAWGLGTTTGSGFKFAGGSRGRGLQSRALTVARYATEEHNDSLPVQGPGS